MLCFRSKTFFYYDTPSSMFNFGSKGLNECLLEQYAGGPVEKYPKVPVDAVTSGR